MSELRVNNITNRDGKTGTVVAGIPQVTSTSHFVPPSGTTAERGSRGRGVFGGGYNPELNTIDYFTIATLGNAEDFGDLTVARQHPGSAASPTRAVFAGGYGASPNFRVEMDYVQIMSTGNAVDYGDLTEGRTQLEGCSNGHGGLG